MVLDFIAWAEWLLCGGGWSSAARRWRYSPDFCCQPAEDFEALTEDPL